MKREIADTRNQVQDADSTRLALAQDILILAIWFGLVVGLIEGTGLWLLQQLGWLAGQLRLLGFSAEIIWISTIFDLLLLGVLGLALVLAARFVPRPRLWLISAFLFLFLAFFDWSALLLSGRIRIYAIFLIAIGLAIEPARWLHKHRDRSTRFLRSSLPLVLAVASLALVAIQGGTWLREQSAVARLPKAAPGSPNILVIVVDALRADHVSSYGYERPTSPNLDRIALEGVQFENAFSTSSWTKPSHASLLTGRYVYEHGADAGEKLDDRYPTLAETLQARGYRTGGFSANIRVFARHEGFARGFHHFEDYYREIGNIAVNTFYGRMIEFYVLHRGPGFDGYIGRKQAPDVNRAVLRWIDRDPGKPFFAVLNYFDVHDPYTPPQPYRSRFSQWEKPGGLINSYWGPDHIYASMTPGQLQAEMDAYDGAIAYVDDYIGQLMAELQERGLSQNTLLIITSDHGESFGEHGLLQHTNSLYREVIHVPLILWWPGHIPARESVATPVSIAALPATLLYLLGEEGQSPFPGPALAALWENPDLDQDWPYPLVEIAQIPWVPAQHLPHHGAMKSVVTSQWHYIVHQEFGEELYDWHSDTQQDTDNLAAEVDMQDMVSQFRTYLETLLAGNSEPLQLSGLPD